MGRAILAFVLSAGFGIGLCFFSPGMGIVAAISIMGAFIMGAFIVYSISERKQPASFCPACIIG